MSCGDVLRRCDSWCHWHGRAQKPLFWAPSGCDVVCVTLAIRTARDEAGEAPATVADTVEASDEHRPAVEMRMVAFSDAAVREGKAMPEALQWIRTEGAWRCCPVR